MRPKVWLQATAVAVAIAIALPLQAFADGPDHGGGSSSSSLCAALGQVSAQTLAVLEATPSLATLLQGCTSGSGGGEGESQSSQSNLCASLSSSQAAALQGVSALSGLLQGCSGSSSQGFSDLSGYGWASSAIAQLAQMQILRGVGQGRFDPGGTLTRAQFAALLTRLFALQAPTSGATAFVDVPAGYWAAADVAAAAPYMSEYKTPGGLAFEPDLPATRIDVAATIGEIDVAEGTAQLPSVPAATAIWAGFSDGGSVPAGLSQAAALAVQLGLMKGYPSGAFGVGDPISRAEAAVLLQRVLATGETMGTGGSLQAAAPTLTGISPATGSAGTAVTLTGTGFTSGATVSFGGVAATSVAVLSLTSIVAVAPTGTGTVSVTVTTAAGTTSPVQFAYTCSSQTVSGSVYCTGS